MIDNQQLRQQLLNSRRQLSAAQVATLSQAMIKQLWQLDAVSKAQHIALYYAVNNEVNLTEFIPHAWQQDKQLYLPCIKQPTKQLNFKHYTKHTKLTPNRYKIPEPTETESIALDQLDIVLVPLVGFDPQCNRLGMGAGFYDRCFADHLKTPRPQKPYLIGLAYEIQKVPQLSTNPWDVPLDLVVTETHCYPNC